MDKYSFGMGTQAQTRYEELLRRIETALGRPVPKDLAPTSAEFDALMAELRARDPKLWKEVIDEISGASQLPAEKEAAQEEARRKAASTLLGPFLRPDGLRTGRKRLNKASLALLGGAVFLAIGMLFQGQSRQPRPQPPVVGGIPTAPSPAAPQPAPSPSPTPDMPATTESPAPQAPPGHAERPQSPPPGTADLPLPPPAPVAQGATPQARVPEQTSPGQQEQQPSMLFRARQQQPADAAPVLYRSASRQEQPQHLAFKAQAGPAQQSGAVLFRAGQPQQTQQPGQDGTPPPEAVQQPRESLRPGQVFQAVLALPVSVSPAWGPVPVLAEVTDGSLSGSTLWGQARMARDGSVEITFTQVLGEGGRAAPFNGVAYDPVAGRPALSGQVRTVMPNALQTILSSSLQAASEYFRARVESQTVTITNGFVTIRQGEPSFWDVYSRSLAQAMTPRTPEGSGPVVVAHLPKGTVISVIVMGQ